MTKLLVQSRCFMISIFRDDQVACTVSMLVISMFRDNEVACTVSMLVISMFRDNQVACTVSVFRDLDIL